MSNAWIGKFILGYLVVAGGTYMLMTKGGTRRLKGPLRGESTLEKGHMYRAVLRTESAHPELDEVMVALEAREDVKSLVVEELESGVQTATIIFIPSEQLEVEVPSKLLSDRVDLVSIELIDSRDLRVS